MYAATLSQTFSFSLSISSIITIKYDRTALIGFALLYVSMLCLENCTVCNMSISSKHKVSSEVEGELKEQPIKKGPFLANIPIYMMM